MNDRIAKLEKRLDAAATAFKNLQARVEKIELAMPSSARFEEEVIDPLPDYKPLPEFPL